MMECYSIKTDSISPIAITYERKLYNDSMIHLYMNIQEEIPPWNWYNIIIGGHAYATSYTNMLQAAQPVNKTK